MDWKRIFFGRQIPVKDPVAPKKAAARTWKILLADDSVTIQKVVRLTLEGGEYELITVDNGDEAIRQAVAHMPDLILADAVMPDKDGYAVCAAIKADARLRSIPVIVLAGTAEGFDERKGAQCGADGWLEKPFESATLINRVEAVLFARRARREK